MSDRHLTTSGHFLLLFRAVDLGFSGTHILAGILVQLAESRAPRPEVVVDHSSKVDSKIPGTFLSAQVISVQQHSHRPCLGRGMLALCSSMRWWMLSGLTQIPPKTRHSFSQMPGSAGSSWLMLIWGGAARNCLL